MPYKSKKQAAFFNWKAKTEGGEWKKRAEHWNKATKDAGGFDKLPKKKKKDEDETTNDSFIRKLNGALSLISEDSI